MARSVRDSILDNRTARARLKPSGKPYYRAIDPGLHLGYRKGKTGGKWVARWYVGKQQYRVETIEGVADDHGDADGEHVLSFGQAQAKARALRTEATRPGASKAGPLTVKQACEAYVEFLRSERRTGKDAAGRLKKHVYQSALADRHVAELTTGELESWKRGLVKPSEKKVEDDPEEAVRRSKDTANRILTMLKAALNRAFADEANGIANDVAWRRVKPFHDVGRARQVHLDATESKRLINSTEGAFRNLVTASLLTGARPPHELATPRVRDFRADLGTLSVTGKTGRRDIVLTKEAVRWFEEVVAGRRPDELLLPKDDGSAWGKNHHVRPMQEAVKKAELSEKTTIYALRHTYASQSILANMNLKLLAENMGTSIRMLELHYAKFIAASRRELVEETAFKLGLKPAKVRRMKVGA